MVSLFFGGRLTLHRGDTRICYYCRISSLTPLQQLLETFLHTILLEVSIGRDCKALNGLGTYISHLKVGFVEMKMRAREKRGRGLRINIIQIAHKGRHYQEVRMSSCCWRTPSFRETILPKSAPHLCGIIERVSVDGVPCRSISLLPMRKDTLVVQQEVSNEWRTVWYYGKNEPFRLLTWEAVRFKGPLHTYSSGYGLRENV